MSTAVRRRDVRFEQLTGRQKAAVLLMALGSEASAQITRSLTAEELEAVTLEIARLDHVPPDVVEAVLAEWQATEAAAHSLAAGGVDYARRLLEDALGPQKAAAVFKRIESQLKESAGLYALRNSDPQQLAGILRNEYPQTVALILAHLDPAIVAEVLPLLDAGVGGEVLFRMARMDKVLPEALEAVERSLGSESVLAMSRDYTSAGGPASVAAVLNLVTGSLEKDLLEKVEQKDHELSEEIKDLMFVFEDIIGLDDRSLQRLLREIESKELALALKAVSEGLEDRIMSAMSQRAVNALKEEMEFLGPVRVRDVEAAQAGIVKAVRALEEAGEIVIGAGDDEYI